MEESKCGNGKISKCSLSIKADNGYTLKGSFSGNKAERIVRAIVEILTDDDS